ncbi:GyrI-like domain-containing protein [bacterium]|nr:GyrI-like domain-containing protein [bacterium]
MAAPDLPSAWKSPYSPSAKQPTLVEVPPLQCLMIDGKEDPNTSTAYQQALETLYAVSYTLKFAIKKASGPSYRVMPLEGLWWSARMEDFLDGAKENWHWTSLIVQPDFVTAEQVEAARREAGSKKPLPALPLLRFEVFREGLCAQISV